MQFKHVSTTKDYERTVRLALHVSFAWQKSDKNSWHQFPSRKLKLLALKILSSIDLCVVCVIPERVYFFNFVNDNHFISLAFVDLHLLRLKIWFICLCSFVSKNVFPHFVVNLWLAETYMNHLKIGGGDPKAKAN